LGWGWTHNYNVELIRESYIPAVTLPISDTQESGGAGDSLSGSGYSVLPAPRPGLAKSPPRRD